MSTILLYCSCFKELARTYVFVLWHNPEPLDMFILKWKQLLHKRFVARDAYMHLKVSNREKFWTNMYSSFPTLHAPYKKLSKTLVEQNDFQCIHNWTYFNLKINENRGMNEIWEVYYLRLLPYKYFYT